MKLILCGGYFAVTMQTRKNRKTVIVEKKKCRSAFVLLNQKSYL